MTFVERIKTMGAIGGAIVATMGVSSIVWGVIVGLGLVVSRDSVADMIKVATQALAAQTGDALATEAKARQVADWQFQLEMANQKVAELLNVEDRSPGQDYELEQAKKLVDQLSAKIAENQ